MHISNADSTVYGEISASKLMRFFLSDTNNLRKHRFPFAAYLVQTKNIKSSVYFFAIGDKRQCAA